MSATLRSALLATLLSSPAFAAELTEETLPRVAPVAEQAGFGAGASLLQDEAFALVDPGAYAALKAARSGELLDEHRALASARSHSEALLATLGLTGTVEGRIKSMYSLHAKMREKDLAMDEVLDRVALRVIVDEVDDAYTLRDALDHRFDVVDDSADDYIANPKPSGYQALHVAVVDPSTRRPVEIQIRTRAMHEAAERGDAAHWRYKLG